MDICVLVTLAISQYLCFGDICSERNSVLGQNLRFCNIWFLVNFIFATFVFLVTFALWWVLWLPRFFSFNICNLPWFVIWQHLCFHNICVLAKFAIWQHSGFGNYRILATFIWCQHFHFDNRCILATFRFWPLLHFATDGLGWHLHFGHICVLPTLAFWPL